MKVKPGNTDIWTVDNNATESTAVPAPTDELEVNGGEQHAIENPQELNILCILSFPPYFLTAKRT